MLAFSHIIFQRDFIETHGRNGRSFVLGRNRQTYRDLLCAFEMQLIQSSVLAGWLFDLRFRILL